LAKKGLHKRDLQNIKRDVCALFPEQQCVSCVQRIADESKSGADKVIETVRVTLHTWAARRYGLETSYESVDADEVIGTIMANIKAPKHVPVRRIPAFSIAT